MEQSQLYNSQQHKFIRISPDGHLQKLAKCSPQDLGFLNELGELLNLRLGRHVHILVSDTNDHATKD